MNELLPHNYIVQITRPKRLQKANETTHLRLCGDRRILTLLIFGQMGLPCVVVVFGMGLPWPSEHQQPAPPIH